jgi:hypothetical protein
VSDDTGPEGYPSLDVATAAIRRYPGGDVFNKEKRQAEREKRKIVKAELEDKIKPRATFAQRQEKLEKKAKREAKEDVRQTAVTERLRAIHAGEPADDVVQLGSDLIYIGALSGIQLEINEQMSSRDKCFTRFTVFGRHDTEFLGMAPTNRDVKFGGVSVTFMSGGKLTQEIHYWDMVALLQQLQAPGA